MRTVRADRARRHDRRLRRAVNGRPNGATNVTGWLRPALAQTCCDRCLRRRRAPSEDGALRLRPSVFPRGYWALAILRGQLGPIKDSRVRPCVEPSRPIRLERAIAAYASGVYGFGGAGGRCRATDGDDAKPPGPVSRHAASSGKRRSWRARRAGGRPASTTLLSGAFSEPARIRTADTSVRVARG